MVGKKAVCQPRCNCRKDQRCKDGICICNNGAKSDDCSTKCKGMMENFHKNQQGGREVVSLPHSTVWMFGYILYPCL